MVNFMDKTTFDWKKYITECMQSTNYCALGTVDEKGVWNNPVFFAWDEQLNLYFISQLHSRHMQNLQKNNSVAVAIYKTEQQGDVAGIQLEGAASILLEDKAAIQHAFDAYFARAGKGSDVQQYIDNPTWIFVQIVPENMYYFDTHFFEEERQKVPLELLIR